MKFVYLFIFFLFPFIGNSQTCFESTELNNSTGYATELDGNRIVSGDVGDNSYTGKVVVSEWNGFVWAETTLLASDGSAGDIFGISLDIDGDRLIVGASGSGQSNIAGYAYVFEFDGTNWNETAKLTASDGMANDDFGLDLALDGDRIVVAAPRNDPNALGSVYVFEYDGSSWIETVKLKASDGATTSLFGQSVDLLGDRIIAGGDVGTFSDGQMYVFDLIGSNWVETILVASDAVPNNAFGFSCFLDNDFMVVGCSIGFVNGIQTGSAYVFEYDGNTWTETAKLRASDGQVADGFGWDVAYDTVSEAIIIGARGDDDNGYGSGSVYVYEWDGNTWLETKYLLSNAGGAAFGDSVDNSADLFVAGAPGFGSVFIFECCSSPQTLFQDSDGDSYGNSNISINTCLVHLDYVVDDTDCDDNDPNNFPGNVEVCDGFDNNCNNQIDEGFSFSTYYADTDGDGFGDLNNTVLNCTQPPGYVADNTDCDDNDANNFPGNMEICDFADNNCDGQIDEGVILTYYRDSDNDGFGDPNLPRTDCVQPPSYVLDNTDCDDNDPNNYPGNAEICDGQDNDCDGLVDEGCGGNLPDCDSVNLVIPVLLQDTNRAEIHLQSNALINSNNPVLFTAGSSIDLNPQFEVVIGTLFEALITPCISN